MRLNPSTLYVVAVVGLLVLSGCRDDHADARSRYADKADRLLKELKQREERLDAGMRSRNQQDSLTKQGDVELSNSNYEEALRKYAAALSIVAARRQAIAKGEDPGLLPSIEAKMTGALHMRIAKAHKGNGQIVEALRSCRLAYDSMALASEAAVRRDLAPQEGLSEAIPGTLKMIADSRAVCKRELDMLEAMVRAGGMSEADGAPTGEQTEPIDKSLTASNIEPMQNIARVHARHILIAVASGATDEAKRSAKTKADAIRERLLAGEDFATLARENSDCPSRQYGGTLSPFGRGQMVKPFEDCVFALRPGEISAVFETQFGYHIAQVVEVHPSPSGGSE